MGKHKRNEMEDEMFGGLAAAKAVTKASEELRGVAMTLFVGKLSRWVANVIALTFVGTICVVMVLAAMHYFPTEPSPAEISPPSAKL